VLQGQKVLAGAGDGGIHIADVRVDPAKAWRHGLGFLMIWSHAV
jgi:hypothetical protein